MNLRIIEYFKILHPYTSIAVSIITMIFSLPLTDSYGFISMVILGLSMLSIQFSIGLTNDLLDINFDRVAKPWKPLVNGNASIKASYTILVILLIISFLSVFQFGISAIFILYFGFLLGITYNLGVKRTLFSWLPYSLAIPTVMVFARVIHENTNISFLILLYPLGLIAGPALNLSNQIPEAENAKLSGEYSLIHKLGIKTAGKISFVLLLALTILIILILSTLNQLNDISIILILIAIVLLTVYFFFLKMNFITFLWPCSILIISFLGLSYIQLLYI